MFKLFGRVGHAVRHLTLLEVNISQGVCCNLQSTVMFGQYFTIQGAGNAVTHCQ